MDNNHNNKNKYESLNKNNHNDNNFNRNDTRSSVVDINNDYSRYLNDELNDEQTRRFYNNIFNNLILNDDNTKRIAENIYTSLLNKTGEYTNLDIEYMSRYTIYYNYYHIKYDENGNVRPGYENCEIPTYRETDLNPGEPLDTTNPVTLAGFVPDYEVVVVDSRFTIDRIRSGDKTALLSYIHSLCHEMVHYKQHYEAKSGICTDSALYYIFDKIIRLTDFDNRDQNYWFRDHEVEAELEGMRQAISIGERYMPTEIEAIKRVSRKREEKLLRETISLQYDDTQTSALRDFYTIGVLITFFQSGDLAVQDLSKKTFITYPQLENFIDPSGKIKSEVELLDRYRVARLANNPIAKIYEMFLIYIYSRDDVMNINLSSERLSEKRLFISNQVRKEIHLLTQLTKLVDGRETSVKITNTFSVNIEQVVRLRIERLEKYRIFLKSVDFDRTHNHDDVLDELDFVINSYHGLYNKALEQNIDKDLIDKEITENKIVK